MPKLPLDLDTLVVSTFETTSAAASDGSRDVLSLTFPVEKTVLCRPSQNWTCTG